MDYMPEFNPRIVKGREQIAFNIGIPYAFYISDVIKKAFNSYAEGNVDGAYWTINALRELINHDLLEHELKELDQIELNILSYKQKYKSAKTREEYQKNKNLWFAEVKNYMRKVMGQVKTQGYLPRKKDRTKLSF